MTKAWILALALGAACQPAGQQPAGTPGGRPGGAPAGGGGTRGTDDVTGNRAQDGATGTQGTDGTRGTTPGTTPSTPPAQPQGMPPAQPQGTTPGTTPGGTAQTPAQADQSTAQALQDAHQMNQHQEKLAKLASSKSKDPAIKAYADQAAREHKESDARLTKLAREEKVSLDIANAARYQNQRDTEQRLGALEGAAFDQAYVVEMVDGGNQAVKVVQGVLTSTQDPKVKGYFVELQPIVQGQLDRAKKLRPPPRGTQ